MGKHTTQCDQIIAHFQLHGSITQRQASAMYGIDRLASRIYDLKESGYKILRFTEEGENRYGVKTRYAKYILDMREEQR